jgi:hypothetical protein
MQYLVRFLFFLLLDIVLIAAAVLAFRKRLKGMRKKPYVEFSMVKESHSRIQWWPAELFAIFALVCLLITVDQAIKLIRFLVN